MVYATLHHNPYRTLLVVFVLYSDYKVVYSHAKFVIVFFKKTYYYYYVEESLVRFFSITKQKTVTVVNAYCSRKSTGIIRIHSRHYCAYYNYVRVFSNFCFKTAKTCVKYSNNPRKWNSNSIFKSLRRTHTECLACTQTRTRPLRHTTIFNNTTFN